MKSQKHFILVAFLFFVSLMILGVQFYWNYNNYQFEKQKFVSEVRNQLEISLKEYHKEQAKRNIISLSSSEGKTIQKQLPLDEIFSNSVLPEQVIAKMDSMGDSRGLKSSKGINSGKKDSILGKIEIQGSNHLNLQQFYKKSEAIFRDSLMPTFSKVVLSVSVDTLSTSTLNQTVREHLNHINFGYNYTNGTGNQQIYNRPLVSDADFQLAVNSKYLPQNSSFQFFFEPKTPLFLSRNWPGLLISLLVISLVASALFYLLYIIGNQKQISEMKNDLMNTVTHELKTPISTIAVALEGIQDHHTQNDKEKVKEYLNTSFRQVERLNNTVDKILETTVLETGELRMNFVLLDLNKLLKGQIESFNKVSRKTISFNADPNLPNYFGDPFHLSQAFQNIIDNAIRYGGDNISIGTGSNAKKISISIEDSGNQISPAQARKIFDKFYRIPKGNQHDIKGFGIGLFYTRSIIHKHLGEITINTKPNTQFIITLPYVNKS